MSVSGQHQRRANIEIENMTERKRDPLVLSGCWTGVAQGSGALPVRSTSLPACLPACQYCQCSLTGGETRLGVNCHPSPCAPGPNNNRTYFADILINLTLVTRFRPFRFRFWVSLAILQYIYIYICDIAAGSSWGYYAALARPTATFNKRRSLRIAIWQ